MMNLEIDGVLFEGFTEASVSKSMEALSGSFNFTATSNDIIQFPIKRGARCRVMVGTFPLITGYVEKISVSYGRDNHTLQISGRDRTCDVIDSCLTGNIEFNSRVSLKTIIERVLANAGITDINVIDNVGTLAVFEADELVSGAVGQKAFEFIECYCRKRQVLCASDGDGNIVLQRASTEQILTALLNEVEGKRNNIVSASVSYDDSQRFNTVTIKSQFNLSTFDSSPENAVDSEGQAQDSAIRSSRKLVVVAETSSNTLTAGERAKWETNIRRARSMTYEAHLQGFFAEADENLIWQPNLLVRAKDDFCDVDGLFLVKAVNYSYSSSAGSASALSLVQKDAYTLQVEMDALDARSNTAGTNLEVRE